MIFGTVKNWSSFQHYRDRSPPWIKLHRSLLNDFEFASLPLASKALAPLLWLLAAESQDGRIRLDPDWLSFRLHIDESDAIEGLTHLIQKGFIETASGVLAECLQHATPETEGETEGEKDSNSSSYSSPPDGVDQHRTPFNEIVNIYHTELPAHPRVIALSNARKAAIRARWRNELPTLDHWRDYFRRVSRSDFLCGRKQSRDREPFMADFEFLIRASTPLKVAEKKYDNR